MNKRVFIIVLDSLGIGAMPDAEKFGDIDCNTLKRISNSKYFSIPHLIKMGIGNIDGIDFLEKCNHPNASIGRMTEASNGKDTTIGHWEIAGIKTDFPLPTYPNGFPKDIIEKFEKAVGRKVLCNLPYSGTKVIEDYGNQHMETGGLIVYTSADSVFQIAAHEDIVPIEQLYEYSEIARYILTGEHSVGRVIARPFIGESPNFVRTANRRDFSLKPFKKTILEAAMENDMDVVSVGKISDIFAGVGITQKYISHSNTEGMQISKSMLDINFNGICFINLVDFDMLYGHRQNIDGYATALSEFDAFLPEFTLKMKSDDLLFITADHGCDPGDIHTDHTREYTPLLVYGKKIKSVNLGTRTTFSDIAATISEYLAINFSTDGKSFWNLIKENHNDKY